MGYSSLLTIDRRAYRLRTFVIISALILCAAGAIALNFTKLSHNAAAATPPDSCFEFDTETGTITNYYDNEGDNPSNPACPKDVDIPSTIGGVSVTTIGYAAFDYKGLTSASIPNSVTSIDDYAFSNNNSLTSVSLGNSIATIGIYAFSTSDITTLVIPDSVIAIGELAFYGNKINSLTLGDSLQSVGENAFALNKISSLTLPESLIAIGPGAFSMNSISSLTVPQSVTSIGAAAFGVNNLSSATIEGTPTLGPGVFMANGPAVSTEDYTSTLAGGGEAAAVQYLIDHSIYLPIYAQNTGAYTDTVYHEQDTFGYDTNGDGVDNPIGGHIINRPQLTVEHVNEDGNEIAPNVMRVGMSLNSYTVASNPDANLSRYYEPGEEITENPEPITGYDTPSPQTRTLAAGQNTVTFVYVEAVDSGDGENNSGNTGGNANGGTSGQDSGGEAADGTIPGAPNTGFAQINPSSPFTLAAIVAIPALLLAIGGCYKIARR